MTEHRFTVDLTSADSADSRDDTGSTPSDTRKPLYRHSLRYESPTGDAGTTPEGPTSRTPRGLTVVTCACGLATEALPSDDARLVYEEHRNVIRDETRRHTAL
ncbi:hypothetical protein ACFYXV_31270 [Streptomyces sp. NPDC002181]|uniref:hypothetical protein n=1 Tax=unclassified Streptomyces TaxID=2593676 RepID=UPI0036679B68